MVHRVLRRAADQEAQRPAARRSTVGVVLANGGHIALAQLYQLGWRQPGLVYRITDRGRRALEGFAADWGRFRSAVDLLFGGEAREGNSHGG